MFLPIPSTSIEGPEATFVFPARTIVAGANEFIDSRSFSATGGGQYFTVQNPTSSWDISLSGRLPEGPRERVVQALEENRFDRLLHGWVVGSLPTTLQPLHFDGWLQPAPDQLQRARAELTRLRSLSDDWNTYGSSPVGEKALANASEVIDIAVDGGGTITLVEATSESTVFVRSELPDALVDFEIDDSEIVGVALKGPDVSPTYHDVPVAGLAKFLAERFAV